MEENDVNGIKRNPDGTFAEGKIGGPGRPKDTPEKIVEKKAIKQIVEEYKAKLADSLDRIEPILVAKALEADVPAIKEIHDRVMGKAQQNVDLLSGGEKVVFTQVIYGNPNPIQVSTETLPTSTPEITG